MIGFLIDLLQDSDFILPLALECQRQKVKYRVFLSRDACLRNTSLISNLKKLKISFDLEPAPDSLRNRYFFRAGWPNLRGITDFLTAVETSARPHQLASSIVNSANHSGIMTFTLQHGFENIGLTYSDREYPIDNVKIQSQQILIWGPKETLYKDLSPEVKNRCVPVGIAKTYPNPSVTSGKSINKKIVVGIFENLHWSRYSDNFRSQFISLVESLPRSFRDFEFRLKPHPAGKWLTNRFKGSFSIANNVVIYDSTQPHQPGFSNNDFVNQCDIILTTPSSVAIDGIACQKPTLIIGYGLDLQNYAPIDIASNNDEVLNFVGDASNNQNMFIDKNNAFLADKIIKINAAEDIIKGIKTQNLRRYS